MISFIIFFNAKTVSVQNENFNPLAYNNDLNDPNLLENFDFEQFLSGDAFNFDAGNFDDPGIEATGMGDA